MGGFTNFLFFPTCLPIGLIVKVCRAISYHIKYQKTHLPPAPYLGDSSKAEGCRADRGTRLWTKTLAARGTASHLVF